jgi:hypothetical protein
MGLFTEALDSYRLSPLLCMLFAITYEGWSGRVYYGEEIEGACQETMRVRRLKALVKR